MICEKCGNNNPDGAAFCRFCGNKMQSAGGFTAPGANMEEGYDNPAYNAQAPDSSPAPHSGERRVSAAHARLMNMENEQAAAGNPRGYTRGNPNGYGPYGGGPDAGRSPYGGGPDVGRGPYGGGPDVGRGPYGGGPYGGNPNGYGPYGGGPGMGNPNARGPYGSGPYERMDYDGPVGGPVKPGPVSKSLPVSKWLIALIGEAVAAFIVFVIVVTLFNGSGSADKTAEKFFVSLVNGNYKKAFSCMNLDKDDFINPKELEFAVSTYDFSKVDNYTVKDSNDYYGSSYGYRDYEDELGKNYVVLYRNKGDSYNTELDINMVKSGKSGKWYVSSGNLIVENFVIYVPTGAKLKIDGIDVSDKYAKAEEDDYTEKEYLVYTIPRIFRGQHYISVTQDGFQELRDAYYVDGYDNSCDMTDQMLSRETMEEINELAVANMQKIYQAALQKQSFETIADLFTADSEDLEYIRDDYENLVSRMSGEDYWVSAIEFQEITAEASAYSPYSNLMFSCTGSCHEKSYSGDVESYTGEADCDLSFNFKMENGNWVQTSLGCQYIYF